MCSILTLSSQWGFQGLPVTLWRRLCGNPKHPSLEILHSALTPCLFNVFIVYSMKDTMGGGSKELVAAVRWVCSLHVSETAGPMSTSPSSNEIYLQDPEHSDWFWRGYEGGTPAPGVKTAQWHWGGRTAPSCLWWHDPGVSSTIWKCVHTSPRCLKTGLPPIQLHYLQEVYGSEVVQSLWAIYFQYCLWLLGEKILAFTHALIHLNLL